MDHPVQCLFNNCRDEVKKRPLTAIENNAAEADVATSTPDRNGGTPKSQAAKRRRILKSFAGDESDGDNEGEDNSGKASTFC